MNAKPPSRQEERINFRSLGDLASWRSFFLSIFRFSASLKLAVIVILALAVELAIATFYEARFGSEAAQAKVYSSRFFLLTLAFLAINVMAAAVIRYPWSRKQYGFAITHLGIEILLLGCLISYMKSIDGQIALRAGQSVEHVNLRREQLIVAMENREPFVVPINIFKLAGYPDLLSFVLHPNREPVAVPAKFELIDGVQVEILNVKTREQERETEIALDVDGHRRQLRLSRGMGSKSMQTPRGLIEVAYGFDAMALPFNLRMEKMGSNDDPFSEVVIDNRQHVTIRPNSPMTIDGMTFYQSTIGDGVSVLSVRRDPGWPIKYGGSALIVLGIMAMFYTRRGTGNLPVNESHGLVARAT